MFPKHWERVKQIQKGNNYVEVHLVNEDSIEWKTIEKKFLRTMPNAVIAEIQRI